MQVLPNHRGAINSFLLAILVHRLSNVVLEPWLSDLMLLSQVHDIGLAVVLDHGPVHCLRRFSVPEIRVA